MRERFYKFQFLNNTTVGYSEPNADRTSDLTADINTFTAILLSTSPTPIGHRAGFLSIGINQHSKASSDDITESPDRIISTFAVQICLIMLVSSANGTCAEIMRHIKVCLQLSASKSDGPELWCSWLHYEMKKLLLYQILQDVRVSSLNRKHTPMLLVKSLIAALTLPFLIRLANVFRLGRIQSHQIQRHCCMVSQ